jgi:hypothetical protein
MSVASNKHVHIKLTLEQELVVKDEKATHKSNLQNG